MLSRTILINHVWGSTLVYVGGTLALLAMTGAAAGQAEEASASLEARIDRLIQQLDDDNPEVRDAATTDLIKIGQPAVAKLIITAKEGRLAAGQRADQILDAVSRTAAGLRFVSAIKRNELQGAVTLVLSPDGNFVYVPAHIAGAINVFRRDAKTGQLTHQQTI